MLDSFKVNSQKNYDMENEKDLDALETRDKAGKWLNKLEFKKGLRKKFNVNV